LPRGEESLAGFVRIPGFQIAEWVAIYSFTQRRGWSIVLSRLGSKCRQILGHGRF